MMIGRDGAKVNGGQRTAHRTRQLGLAWLPANGSERVGVNRTWREAGRGEERVANRQQRLEKSQMSGHGPCQVTSRRVTRS